jgi:UDP-3-O-[3-hydroxymyristoyl] glucosamine N-acyltransferase
LKFSELSSMDSSFSIVKGTGNETLSGVTDAYEQKESHLLFIKNKIYMQSWIDKKKPHSNFLVIEKKYFDLINDEQKKNIFDNAIEVATVADVNLAMSFFSKTFYDLKYKTPNDVIDGRQMGTANVDPSAWIAQGAFVGESVVINKNVKIHPGVVLMSGVEIGEGCEIFPNTVIYRGVKIGKQVRIHSNCSIGADGFGYNFSKGEHLKVWQLGSVIIGDNVEIGANSCIDSGTFSPTIIGDGCKFDNLVQVGHNCKLGKGVILCGQVGLAGSCTIGDYCVFGGKSGAADGVTIGRGVQVAGTAGVTNNLGDGEVVGGFPARNIKEWMKGIAYVRKLSLGSSKSANE